MELTQYPQVNKLLEILLSRLKSILDEKLIGLYLEGSLVWGDFDANTSDIDLLAVLSSNIDYQEFEALRQMHTTLVTENKEWDDRIEVCYISTEALKKIKLFSAKIVNISPGEPFHRTESSKEWTMNLYLTREKSKILFGPSPKTLIEPISKREFIQSAKDHAKSWKNWIQGFPHNRYAQAYAILTICRALYVVRNGNQVSKKRAALWVKKEIPEWSDFVQKAIIWKNAGKDIEADDINFPKTVQFVHYMRDKILEKLKDKKVLQ